MLLRVSATMSVLPKKTWLTRVCAVGGIQYNRGMFHLPRLPSDLIIRAKRKPRNNHGCAVSDVAFNLIRSGLA